MARAAQAAMLSGDGGGDGDGGDGDGGDSDGGDGDGDGGDGDGGDGGCDGGGDGGGDGGSGDGGGGRGGTHGDDGEARRVRREAVRDRKDGETPCAAARMPRPVGRARGDKAAMARGRRWKREG